jgi:hyperosmotically inducible protein
MTVPRFGRVVFRGVVLATTLSLAAAGCGRSLAVSTDDASITARVRTVLLNDPEVGANQIRVSTSGGVVEMTGSVDSPSDAQRAEQLARGVEGVRDVRSTLQVAEPGF